MDCCTFFVDESNTVTKHMNDHMDVKIHYNNKPSKQQKSQNQE